MEKISVSKFKVTCSAVLQRVKRTGRPILVTRYGEPVAKVTPPSASALKHDWLGCMKGRGELREDIVGPAIQPRSWKALRG